LDSASAQPAGLGPPAVESSDLDAIRDFTELAGLSIDELWQDARCESVDLRRNEFATALLATGNRYNFGLATGLMPGRAQIGNFLRGYASSSVATLFASRRKRCRSSSHWPWNPS